MNDLPIEQSVKEVIQNIFICSGEPYSVSDTVVHIVYKHIRLVANLYATNLQTETPKLSDFIHTFQTKPFELLRIAKYFMILSTSKEIANVATMNSTNLDDTIPDSEELQQKQQQTDDNDFTDLLNDINRKTGWLRFLEICTKEQIDLPNKHDLFEAELQYTPNALVRGRRLRLSRIDEKTASSSSDDYVMFTRLRQSASFLKFVKRRLRIDFWHWIFNHKINDSNPSWEIDLKGPEIREGIRILAYLLTSHVWDVIDMALSRRQALKIDMTSPLTPIEVKESIRQLQKLLLQTHKEL